MSAFWCLCYLELWATPITVVHKMDGCNCYYVYCVQFQRATNINVVWFIAPWKNEPLNVAWLWLFFITWNIVEELVCLMRIIDLAQSVQNIIITVSRLKRVLFIMCKNIQGILRNFVPTYYTDCTEKFIINEGNINLLISIALFWAIYLIVNEHKARCDRTLYLYTNIVNFPPSVSVYSHVQWIITSTILSSIVQ